MNLAFLGKWIKTFLKVPGTLTCRKKITAQASNITENILVAHERQWRGASVSPPTLPGIQYVIYISKSSWVFQRKENINKNARNQVSMRGRIVSGT